MADENTPQSSVRPRAAGEGRMTRVGSAPKPKGEGKRVSTRERGTDTRIKSRNINRSTVAPKQREYASAGRYTQIKGDKITEDIGMLQRYRGGQPLTVQYPGIAAMAKTAGFLGQSDLGPANIADSDNIGYYNFEFPVDALMLPASRPEELRYYRLAYDRDPIVARAIDMHTEIPLSKMILEKPKCSSEEFSDYVFDYFQSLVTNTKMFPTLIDAVREYWTIGETFLYVEEDDEVEPSPMAQKQIEGKKDSVGLNAETEAEGAQTIGNSSRITEWLEPGKRSSLLKKFSTLLDELKTAGIEFDPDEDVVKTARAIKIKKAALTKLASGFIQKFASILDPKTGKIIKRVDGDEATSLNIKIAAPPAAAGAPGAAPGAVAGPGGNVAPGAGPGETAPGAAEGGPMGPEGAEGVEGIDEPGAGAPPPGGGGGGGAPVSPTVSQDQLGTVSDALRLAEGLKKQREIMTLKRYLRLLERKKELLEQLKEVREKKAHELELFSHVVNHQYEGFSKIQILPPEQVEIAEEKQTLASGPEIFYKPPETQKQVYLEDPDVPQEVKDTMEAEGKVALNKDPFGGSYVIHFARKKSGYELHGRSILQRCLRTILYRDKLRQVQMTLASRNMTPKTLVIAPDIPASEVQALRAHIDEAKADPDYTIVVNYDAQWNEIGSEGRLLSLDSEWSHTNSDLAIGLGLSPEILIGEGLYSGNRIQLELMNVSYLQFRDMISSMVEEQIFKPIAQKKGFYEMDKYGRPRWIYPKVSFTRMALRDSGDLYDMMYNLYSKGSLPISIILEFLNIDPETVKRQLEQDLFSVNDSKFNELMSAVYTSVNEYIIKGSDVVKRIIKGMTLDEVDEVTQDQDIEGSGEGV